MAFKYIPLEDVFPQLKEPNLPKESSFFVFVYLLICLAAFYFFKCYFQKKLQKYEERRNGILPFKIDWAKDLRKTWVFIFCIVSLVVCIFFVPCDVYGWDGKLTGEIIYINYLEKQPPASSFWKRHRINYSSMAFREVLIIVGCVGGYTLTTMIKKSKGT